MEGFLNRGWGSIFPGCGGAVGLPEGQLALCGPSLADGGRGGELGQWGWGSENAGMTRIGCYIDYYKRKNRRASRAIFFLIGLRQAKVPYMLIHVERTTTP